MKSDTPGRHRSRDHVLPNVVTRLGSPWFSAPLARKARTRMPKSNGPPEEPSKGPPGITSLSVSGFKSIVDEQTIEIRPLTLLAAANSSGKSSMMPPLLLLKQTLEAPYDPGPLLLNGPNVKFTSARQFYPVAPRPGQPPVFRVVVGVSDETEFSVSFRWEKASKSLVPD